MNFGLLILPFNKEFSFVCFHGFLQKVMPEDVKNENPKEASGGSRKRKAN